MERTGRDLARSRAAGIVAQTIVAELATPAPEIVVRFVEGLIGGARPLGVLFYGSILRTHDAAAGEDGLEKLTEGVLDFYVIVDRLADWPRGWISRLANAVLPPNVEYHEQVIDGHVLRAKVAILTLAQFRRMTCPDSRDTTVWSRFSQPSRLVWVRDERAADDILRGVIRAVGTAARWAALLGPESGPAENYWENLFRKTYAVELRVEKKGRSRSLIRGMESRYAGLLGASWVAGGLDAALLDDGRQVAPEISPARRRAAARRWKVLSRMGGPLNYMRLMKASFTFAGGVQYILWKIRRHRGVEIPLTAFEERHPLLCAPVILMRLSKAGVFADRRIDGTERNGNRQL